MEGVVPPGVKSTKVTAWSKSPGVNQPVQATLQATLQAPSTGHGLDQDHGGRRRSSVSLVHAQDVSPLDGICTRDCAVRGAVWLPVRLLTSCHAIHKLCCST
jgi:hypothetical protein